MYRARTLVATAVLLATAGHATGAQSAVEYRVRVDSLARTWRGLVAREAETRSDSGRRSMIPRDSVRIGSIIVRADTAFVAIGRKAAERLAPRVERAYGTASQRLARYQFVIRGRSMETSPVSVVTGAADSTGEVRLRSTVFAEADAIAATWAQKVQDLMTGEIDPDVRHWLRTTVPLNRMDAESWSHARIDLLVANAEAARRCANDDAAHCSLALGLSPVTDAAFAYYNARERRTIVERHAGVLRRADPAFFDRCSAEQSQPACDSLVRMVPSEAIDPPVPPSVRQSLTRYALDLGGDGAFDRFMRPAGVSERLAAAAQVPIDSLIARWREKLLDSRTSSTALDATTALSSLFWIGLCACLSLRSSRWR